MTDASGNTLGDTSIVGNRFAFTGREYDEETDLSYYRTRYLEHAWGRFTTRDTIGTWGDQMALGSGLAYVASAPTRYADPAGLVPEDVTPWPPGHNPNLTNPNPPPSPGQHYHYPGGFSPPGGWYKFYVFRPNASPNDVVEIGADFLDLVRSQIMDITSYVNNLVNTMIRIAERQVRCGETRRVSHSGSSPAVANPFNATPVRLTMQSFVVSWDISCTIKKTCSKGKPPRIQTRCQRRWSVHDRYDFDGLLPYLVFGWEGTPFNVEGHWCE